MSFLFYLEEEENKREKSINNYCTLFEPYKNNIPTLKEALFEMYVLSELTKEEVVVLINDIITKCQKKLVLNKNEINAKYPNISDEDILIICSYTCESIDANFSPYKILNRNLVSENRENGLRIVSKYLFIFLKSLRKLPRYYPDKNNGYLYRCINRHINYKIDPFDQKSVPYMIGQPKTFWGFTSTSQNIKTSYIFLGEKNDLKSGTIFTLFGDVWGYDITLFNYYNEEEILLEPERKFIVEQIYPPVNDIIHVRCKVEDSPLILNEDTKNKVNKISNSQNKNRIAIKNEKNNATENKTEIIKCKKGKNHEISNITGKCRNCNVLGCEKGLSEHNFSNITGKCRFCAIMGCEKGLTNHDFSNITGKCKYCQILGCSHNLNAHNFSMISGKCKYCSILGCQNDLLEHNFNQISGKCVYCQVIGCKNGLSKHNFNMNSGKCTYCHIIGCQKGLCEHNFNKNNNKCIYCNYINPKSK